MSIIEKYPKNAEIDTEVLFAAKADVMPDGTFGAQWLMVTKDQLFVTDGSGETVIKKEVTNLKETSIQTFVGGGSLNVKTTDDDVFIMVRFTPALMKKFVFANKIVEALIKKEPIPQLSKEDQIRNCEKCARPLDEGVTSCARCMDKKQVVKRLLKYAKPYQSKVVIATILMIATTFMALVPPIVTRSIVDDVLAPNAIGPALITLVLLLAGMQLLSALLDGGRGLLGVWVGSKIMTDLRADTYNHLMNLSLKYFDNRQTSQFIGRVNGDVESIRMFLTEGVLWVVGQMMQVVAIVAVMLTLNWRLTLFALAPLPLFYVVSKTIWPIVRNSWYRSWRSSHKLGVIVGDTLQGIRVVKAFGKEGQEKSRYEEANNDLMKQTVYAEGLWQGIFPIFTLITGISLLLVWYFGGNKVLGEEVTIGTLMAFIAYLGMFFGPLQWFSQMVSWTNRAMAAADRTFEIMDTKSDVPEARETIDISHITGIVKLDSVTFGYESHIPVLKNTSLEVAAGEMIGLVGHSGAGKSTLINLLCRFYDVDQGAITIDGIDLREMNVTELHHNIGVVLQDTFLFDGTIAQNIAYSKPDATPEEIMRAAKIANAHDFIVETEDGYDSSVGERGNKLSGGQRQRISIARAILHDPKILILDEATASVDTDTEKKIQEAIQRLVKGRTTFAIAHRLSTLKHANRLVVIEKGEIAEMGTHDELLNQKGIYFKLVEAQKEMSQIKGVAVE